MDDPHKTIYIIEIIIIVSVIIVQIFLSTKIFKNILVFKEIFRCDFRIKNGFIEKEKLGYENSMDDIVFSDDEMDGLTDNDIVNIALTEVRGGNLIIENISNDINRYLINNHGAPVNFGNIRDIIDREIDMKDEEISQEIPTPLYLGLAATMIGIIFGLLAMPNINNQSFSDGISILIKGVRLAMCASLMGLFLTTILSSFVYKGAKNRTLKGKNGIISYLQAKLLPELIKAEVTGIPGLVVSISRLDASINNFNRSQVTYTSKLTELYDKVNEDYDLHYEIIEELRDLNVNKISKTNIDLLNKLEKNKASFDKFAEYIDTMGKISDNLLDFANRTNNMDTVVTNINESLVESKQLFQFLTAHINKLESFESKTSQYVDLADSYFSGAIEKLKEEITNRINKLNETAGIHHSDIVDVYESIKEDLNKVTEEHLRQFQDAYSAAVPRFNQLDHLETLPQIQSSVIENMTEFQNDSSNNTSKVIESINQIKGILGTIRNDINNQEILGAISSIEDKIYGNVISSGKKKNIKKKTGKPTVIPLNQVIYKLFSRK